jgi:Holliday junction resolvase RusA-like endonuclease
MIYEIVPVAKPRMTRQDKFRGKPGRNIKAMRPAVAKYWAFKAECRLKMTDVTLDNSRIIFFVPMPKSWSKRKQVEMNTRPHRSRPDLDNFAKALFDALYSEDSMIADVCLSKRWAYRGGIEILTDV